MRREKEDRRIRMTKRLLREGLIRLLSQNPISKISVKMICEAADINRSTFYAHYADQYDLLQKIQEEVLLDLKEYLSSTLFMQQQEDATAMVTQILEYAKANAMVLRVLLGEHGGAAFQKEVIALAQKSTLESLRSNPALSERTALYIELYTITGALSVVRCWLEGDCAQEPGAVARLTMKLVFHGIYGACASPEGQPFAR